MLFLNKFTLSKSKAKRCYLYNWKRAHISIKKYYLEHTYRYKIEWIYYTFKRMYYMSEATLLSIFMCFWFFPDHSRIDSVFLPCVYSIFKDYIFYKIREDSRENKLDFIKPEAKNAQWFLDFLTGWFSPIVYFAFNH